MINFDVIDVIPQRNKKIYFISDLHFYNSSILNLRTQFKDINDMNKYIIKKWNETVENDDDIVYILGDFFYFLNGQIDEEITQIFSNLVDNLRGEKHLILGNIDTYNIDFYLKFFKTVSPYGRLSYNNYNFILFHYPILEWEGYAEGYFHLFGHTLGSLKYEDQKIRIFDAFSDKRALCVSCDDVNIQFRPIEINKIIYKLV